MEYNKEFIELIVKRYVSGRATAEELEVFLHLLKDGKLDGILDQHMDHEIATLLYQQAKGKHLSKWPWTPLRIAASVAIFFLCSLIAIRHHSSIVRWFDPVEYIQVRTARSEIKEITLTDGSKVRLNTGSVLEYPEEFADTIRAVRLLEGEAFFTIAHDTSKPFIVLTGGIRTQVLGTEFNIRSYSTFETIQVTVATGKVTVRNLSLEKEKQSDAVLEADDQLSIDRSTGLQKKNKVNVMETLGWREGKLFFDNERFADVALILANKFDIHIVFADPVIKDYRFSAAFEATDSLHIVFDALSLANNVSYTIHDKTITLKKIENPK